MSLEMCRCQELSVNRGGVHSNVPLIWRVQGTQTLSLFQLDHADVLGNQGAIDFLRIQFDSNRGRWIWLVFTARSFQTVEHQKTGRPHNLVQKGRFPRRRTTEPHLRGSTRISIDFSLLRRCTGRVAGICLRCIWPERHLLTHSETRVELTTHGEECLFSRKTFAPGGPIGVGERVYIQIANVENMPSFLVRQVPRVHGSHFA